MTTSKASPPVRAALADEAKEQLVSFVYDGETYRILPGDEWDIAILEAAEDGKIITAAKMLLGPEQYKRFRARPRKNRDMRAFFEAAGEVMGGNS